MRTTIGVMLCAAALVAGCGTVSGQAESENPTASDPAFDPCEGIPDGALRDAGVDPASETRDILGVHQPGWNLCWWRGDAMMLSAYSSNYTFDDVRRHPDYVDFQDIELGGRPGMSFRYREFTGGEDCYAAIATPSGLFMLSAEIDDSDLDACTAAESAIVRFLPYTTK